MRKHDRTVRPYELEICRIQNPTQYLAAWQMPVKAQTPIHSVSNSCHGAYHPHTGPTYTGRQVPNQPNACVICPVAADTRPFLHPPAMCFGAHKWYSAGHSGPQSPRFRTSRPLVQYVLWSICIRVPTKRAVGQSV